MPERTFTTNVDRVLDFAFDPEERLTGLRRDHTVKGLFTIPVVKKLGPAEYARLRPSLLAPPRSGYVPFLDYPVADHQRLTVALVQRQYPDLPLAQGMRLIERSTAERFAESTFGKVVLAVLDGPRSALLKLPEVSDKVTNVGSVVAKPLSDGGVLVQYRDYSGFLDCAMVGSLEGVVMFFSRTPTIDVTLLTERDADYVLRWQ